MKVATRMITPEQVLQHKMNHEKGEGTGKGEAGFLADRKDSRRLHRLCDTEPKATAVSAPLAAAPAVHR